MNLKTKDLLDLEHTICKDFFVDKEYPWEVLAEIKALILKLGQSLGEDYIKVENKNIWIGKGTSIDDCVKIMEPTIIGLDCEIRHGAYIRGNVIIGDKVVVGNSSELKNSIVFDGAQIPHFNYVGDSILGYKSHIGAGVKLSNLKSDKSLITIVNGDKRLETGIKKMGAIIGDYVEVGCNAVLNPGTVIGRESNVYPLTFVRGLVPEHSILKNNGDIVEKRLGE